MHNTVKRLSIFLALLLCIQIYPVLSQVSDQLYTPDSRLYQCMDKSYVDQLSGEKSEVLLYYNFYLDNSYYIASLKAEKPVTGIDIHTVTLNEKSGGPVKFFNERTYASGTFNPLKYNFTRSLENFTTYVWKEAGVAIIFIPQRQFQERFLEYLKKNNITR